MYQIIARLLLIVTVLGLAPIPQAASGSRLQQAEFAVNISANRTSNWSWTLGPEQVIFSYRGDCTSGPVIWRTPLSGGTVRALFERAPVGACDAYEIRSNIVSDGGYLYWMDATGLVRMPIAGGELPVLMNPNYRNDAGYHSLTILDDYVYAGSGRTFWRSNKIFLDGGETIATLPFNAERLSSDGAYVYFLSGGDLYATTPGSPPSLLVSNVQRYYAEGLRPPLASNPARRYVFYSTPGSTAAQATVRRLDLFSGDNDLVYTSNAPAGTYAQIEALASDRAAFNSRLFFWEHVIDNCGAFVCSSALTLYRSNLNGGGRAAIASETSNSAQPPDGLLYAEGGLFYRLFNQIYRIGAYGDALPTTNLIATGLQITQGVQRADGSVPLIAGKRTFVRLLVRSEGSSTSRVRARLYGEGGGISPRTLAPINSGEGGLTIGTAPDPLALQQSFLFELPDDWARANGLVLTAVVNPFNVPRESNTADNSLSSGALTFRASGSFSPLLVRYRYSFGGATYSASTQDVERVGELTRALFPLDSAPGNQVLGNNRPGFHPDVIEVTDDGIGPRIYNESEPLPSTIQACQYLIVTNPTTQLVTDQRDICVGDYVNANLIRVRQLNGQPADRFVYAFVPPLPTKDPRGLAHGGSRVASGSSTGTYGMFTAVHELSHVLGRNHPLRGSQSESMACTNTLADGGFDFDFPYANGNIGPDSSTVLGLDYLGYFSPSYKFPAVGGQYTLLPGNMTSDLLSYCHNQYRQWVSDYNYSCLMLALTNQPPGAGCDGLRNGQATTQRRTVARPQAVDGDWLSVIGTIVPGSGQGIIHHVDRLQRVNTPSDTSSGSYRLRLLGEGGAILADYPFEPGEDIHSATLPFALVVPFVAGTRELRLLAPATQAGLAEQSPSLASLVPAQAAGLANIASRTISANPPTLSAVALESPADPVTTTATLAWQAADADGNPLSYDVFFSGDGGASFEPLRTGLSGNRATLDLSQVGTAAPGAQAIFRVIANDGAQTAMADSPAYTLEPRAPQPVILSPQAGSSSQYGQLISFRGTASDAQDGAITGGNLIWSLDGGAAFATGESASLDDLQPGTHIVTLTTYNSRDMVGETSITITVGDDLSGPQPALSVAPVAVSAVAAPGGAAQSFSVAIDNLGDGALEWTASANAAWLTLGASSGSTPGALTLTLNPAALSARQTYTTTMTISATLPGGTAQTLSVPVSIAVQDSYLDDDTTPIIVDRPNLLYLPLLMR